MTVHPTEIGRAGFRMFATDDELKRDFGFYSSLDVNGKINQTLILYNTHQCVPANCRQPCPVVTYDPRRKQLCKCGMRLNPMFSNVFSIRQFVRAVQERKQTINKRFDKMCTNDNGDFFVCSFVQLGWIG